VSTPVPEPPVLAFGAPAPPPSSLASSLLHAASNARANTENA
jgi:hypothetical protein